MEQGIKAGNRIGKNIRRFRRAMDITQAQLAAKLQVNGCDITRSTVAKIEAGVRHVSVEELEALKEILNMRYEDFFAKEENRPSIWR